MDLVVLGSAGWMGTGHRETSCYALRKGSRLLLLDAGTGARRLITDPSLVAGIDRIDVVLSHFHLDHIIGLTYLSGLRDIGLINVHGPGRTLYDASTEDVLAQVASPPFQPATLADSGIRVSDIELHGMWWDDVPIELRHQARHTAPSLAVRVGDQVAYCSDTEYDSNNGAFASGCQILLHDSWWVGDSGSDGHSSSLDAAKVASAAEVGRLGLIHIAPTADTNVLVKGAQRAFANSYVVSDLDHMDFE